MIGDVLVAYCGLLGEVFGPAEEFQDRADQILLGHRLVGLRCSPRTSRIARRRPSGTLRNPVASSTDACHSGVVRMPSIRK